MSEKILMCSFAKTLCFIYLTFCFLKRSSFLPACIDIFTEFLILEEQISMSGECFIVTGILLFLKSRSLPHHNQEKKIFQLQ